MCVCVRRYFSFLFFILVCRVANERRETKPEIESDLRAKKYIIYFVRYISCVSIVSKSRIYVKSTIFWNNTMRCETNLYKFSFAFHSKSYENKLCLGET